VITTQYLYRSYTVDRGQIGRCPEGAGDLIGRIRAFDCLLEFPGIYDLEPLIVFLMNGGK
jgi:hypothetical protein